MKDIFLIIILLVLIIFLIGYIWYLVDTILNSLPNRVGYVGSNLNDCGEPLKKIIEKYIPNTSKISLIEPGAGLGNVARYLGATFAWKDITATDLSAILLILASFLNRNKTHIRFVWKNIFTYQYPKNACIYCYLRSHLLDKLYAQGSLKGNLVICLTFPLTDIKPTEIVPIHGWQKQFLVYDFR